MLKKVFCIAEVIILLSLIYPALPICAIEPPAVSAKGAILMETDSGNVLYEINPDKQLPMASTTKIMTALLVLEQAERDDRIVEITKEMVSVEGTSMGLLPGDRLKLSDLAVGMLLASGNDAANAAAIAVSGSKEKFVALMNQKARELGMNNTSFATPSGLDADDHYSTARDMAVLTCAALKNEKFASICALKNKRVEMENRTLALSNHNKLLSMYKGCIGVKTGFTKKSGRCLVSAAERNGITMVAVTLCASDDWNAHMSMLNFGFSRLMTHNGTVELADTYTIPLAGGTEDKVKLVPAPFDGALVQKESNIEFTYEIHLPRFLYAPVEEGQIAGEIICYLNGKKIAAVDLLTDRVYEYSEAEEKENKPGFFERLFSVKKDTGA